MNEDAKTLVCAEILSIMDIYHQQEERGEIDTPGGLENMWDVWSKFLEWERKLRVVKDPADGLAGERHDDMPNSPGADLEER